MKKITAIVLIFLLSIPYLNVYAAQTQMSIGSIEYLNTRTDTALVPVKLNQLPVTSAFGNGTYGAGVIVAKFDTKALKYIGIKTGSMVSSKGAKSIYWVTKASSTVNVDGEIRLVFFDQTLDGSKSYGQGSFEANTKDTLLYLEFEVLDKTVGKKLPITLVDGQLSGNVIIPQTGTSDAIYMTSLMAGNNLDTQGGEIQITWIDTNLYIIGFQLEVKSGVDQSGNSTYEKYPAVMDGIDSKEFSVVVKPDKNGVVTARVIPMITLPGATLEIKCNEPQVVINGNSITIPNDVSLKTVDLSIRVVKEDKTVISATTYKLTIIRGNLTADVTIGQGITATAEKEAIMAAVNVNQTIISGNSVELVLDIKKDDQNQNSKAFIEKAMGSQQLAGIFEISLKKIVNNTQTTQITETQRPITISIELPESMRNGKDYKIVRVHNGVAEIIPATKNGNLLSFSTDRFSAYGIIYTPNTGTGTDTGTDPGTGTGTGTGTGAGTGTDIGTGGPIAPNMPTPTPEIPVITPANDSEHLPYITGYPDKTFKPQNNITRAEVVTMLSQLSNEYNKNKVYVSNFPDVSKNKWYSNYVGFANKNAMVSGYPKGDFKPNANMTRAEFVTVIAKFAKLQKLTDFSLPFKDAKGHWAEGYISALSQKGMISGYKDGSFRPNANITRAEAVTVINRVLERTPNKEKIELNNKEYKNSFSDILKTHWAYFEMLEATIKHQIEDFH